MWKALNKSKTQKGKLCKTHWLEAKLTYVKKLNGKKIDRLIKTTFCKKKTLIWSKFQKGDWNYTFLKTLNITWRTRSKIKLSGRPKTVSIRPLQKHKHKSQNLLKFHVQRPIQRFTIMRGKKTCYCPKKPENMLFLKKSKKPVILQENWYDPLSSKKSKKSMLSPPPSSKARKRVILQEKQKNLLSY